jgi:DnaJ family protein C protein 28
LNGWERIIEDQILDAMGRGVFDHLPGRGRPADVTVSPFEHPLAGTFRRILRDNGSSHPVIEARKALDQELQECREQLWRAWKGYCRFRHEPAWRRAKENFRGRIQQLNRVIKLHNLKAPAPAFHLRVADCEAEIQAVARRPAD